MLIRTGTREIEVEVDGRRCFVPCDDVREERDLYERMRLAGCSPVFPACGVGVVVHLGEVTFAKVRDVLIARDAL